MLFKNWPTLCNSLSLSFSPFGRGWCSRGGFDSPGGLKYPKKSKDMARRKAIKKTPAVSRRFESLCEFSRWLENTPATSGFPMASETSDYEFTKTESFEVANKMMLGGWDSGAADVEKIMFENTDGVENARRFALSVAGAIPCVPAYLAGSPANMIAIKRRKIARPVITICYNCAVPGCVEADDIKRVAAKLLNVVRGLEAGGVGVNLWACSFSLGFGDSVTMAVKIKSSDEPFNVLNMAYPLVHPSFNRRHKFAFIERCGGDARTWDGYGRGITDSAEMQRMAASVGIDGAICFCYDSLSWRSESEILNMIK